MPAAAVIPAPLAYTIIVAVKRLVVGLNYIYCVGVWEHTYIWRSRMGEHSRYYYTLRGMRVSAR